MDNIIKQYPIGINYEGGKIIRYALNGNKCIAYANIQIAMDAPFHGQVANDTLRIKGRSETQFEGYNDDRLKKQLHAIFSHIDENYEFDELVIQIARGKSAYLTEMDILKPVMQELNFPKYRVHYGYRTKDYFPYPENNFIFVNIGMFARLTNINWIKAGDICNPIETYDILGITDNGFQIENHTKFHNKNILNGLDFEKIILYGIADDMPFITPDSYQKELFDDLIQQ